MSPVARLLLGASLLAPMPALAQSAAEETAVQEVIVTAQRREERLRDVPIAITAVSGEQLAASGASGVKDLSQLSPGVVMQAGGAFSQPTIRGIGTTATGAGTDANVAIYVDGVYMPSQYSNFFEFNNIERIEILKGPQGTLFGRNATGGAISITTSAPPEEPDFKAQLGVGNLGLRTYSAYAGGPIVGALKGNIALQQHDDHGFVYDPYRRTRMAALHEFSGRAKLLYEFSDKFNVTLSADYAKRKDTAALTATAYNGNTTGPRALVPTDPRQAGLTFTPTVRVENRGASLRWQYDAEVGRFTQISSWRRVESDISADLDRTPAAIGANTFGVRQSTISHELNFSSVQMGKLSFVSGLFYYYDRANNDDLISNGTRLAVALVRSEAYAAYTELNVDVTDRLRVIGGMRYSHEERALSSRLPSSGARIHSARDWSAWTPRVSVRYALTPDLNVYGTYSRGFKSGTYNASTFADQPVNPEKVEAFEVGAKYFSRGLVINASAYHYDYDDIQINAISPQNGLTFLLNAARAKIYGGDVEFQAPVTTELTLSGGAAYTHGRYTDFPNAIFFTPRPTGGNIQSTRDASGNTMLRAPTWTANLAADYKRPLAGGELGLNANLYYNSGYYWTVSNRLKQPSYTTLNASASWSPDNGRYRVAVWGRNLTDELIQSNLAESVTSDGVSYTPPRTYGVTVSVDF